MGCASSSAHEAPSQPKNGPSQPNDAEVPNRSRGAAASVAGNQAFKENREKQPGKPGKKTEAERRAEIEAACEKLNVAIAFQPTGSIRSSTVSRGPPSGGRPSLASVAPPPAGRPSLASRPSISEYMNEEMKEVNIIIQLSDARRFPMAVRPSETMLDVYSRLRGLNDDLPLERVLICKKGSLHRQGAFVDYISNCICLSYYDLQDQDEVLFAEDVNYSLEAQILMAC